MNSSQNPDPAPSFRLLHFTDVKLLGPWSETTNDLGQLIGFRATGTNCEVTVRGEGILFGQYGISSGAAVAVTGNVIAIPIFDESEAA